MPRCVACGEENPEHARFCLACGAQLEPQATARPGARKTVTVLFADVVSSTALVDRLEPESTRQVLDRFYERMRGAVEGHGGTVEKFIGDAIMAVFGIPVLHEDDALRAVRASLDMRTALDELNAELERSLGVTIAMRVGLEAGEVVTGDPAQGLEFVTGDAVIVAQRLEASAGAGEIRIGEGAYRLVRHAVRAEALGPITLKGRAEPLEMYRLLDVEDPGSGRRRASALVGRDEELGVLSKAYEQVCLDRTARLVTVIGAAGVGKSRLIEEFLNAHSGDATVVKGRCLPYGDGITFWPLKEMVAQAAGLSDSEGSGDARIRVRTLVAAAPDGDLVAERLAETIGLTDAVPEHKGTGWAVRRLFEELARDQPLVVVVDDIQWAEATLLELLDESVRELRGSPVLVVCMARPELLNTHMGWAASHDRASSVSLEPLSDTESSRLLANLLGGDPVDQEVRAKIVEAADGLPLFVEEMVAKLVDEGALVRDKGRWIARDLLRITAPATIHALLAARLDQLEPPLRLVLERGAVEGQVFHRAGVEYLSPESDRAGVEPAISELVLRDLVEPETAQFAGEDAFRFHHLLLRDVAYESVRKEERASLHERFADWLDEQAGERASEFDEIAGYHLEQACRYRSELKVGGSDGRLGARASKRLGAAGLRAYARGDWPGSASLLARGLALSAPDSELTAQMEPKLAEARLQIAPAKVERLASMRCFWRWQFGHRWTGTEREGVVIYRCAACGRERRRGAYDARDDVKPPEQWGGMGI
jgi:class 3 adenylate cyclase